MKKLKKDLYKIGSIIPSKSFRQNARSRLFQQINLQNEEWFYELSRKSIPKPSIYFKYSFMQSLFETVGWKYNFNFLKFTKIFALTGVFSLFLTIGLSFFLFLSPTSAEEKTIIANFNGIVQIGNILNDDFVQVNGEEMLNTGSIVRTANNSTAEIVFFEDSIIRLDQNSEIEIRKLIPNNFIAEIGDVAINLNYGRIWVRSFGLNNEYATFELHSGSVIVFPERGTFDISREGNLNQIRVFDRSVKVSHRGDRDRVTFSLIANKKININLKGLNEIENITDIEKTETWMVENIIRNQIYIDNLLMKKMVAIEEWEKIGEFLHSIKPESGRKYLELSEKSFKKAIRLSFDNQLTEAEIELDNFLINLKKAIDMDPSIINIANVTLQNESKYLQFALPQEELFASKKAIERAKEIIAIDQNNVRGIQEERVKETLWEAHKIAASDNSSKILLTEAQIENFSNELEEIPMHVEDPQSRADILDQKSEELQILDDLQDKVIIGGDIVEKAEEAIVNDIIEVSTKSTPIRPGFPGKVQQNTIDDLISRVNIYSTEKGQENMVRNILNNYENSANNLSELLELKKNLPPHVKSMVTDKMVEIIKVEKKKAANEGI